LGKSQAKYVSAYIVWLWFEDSIEGEVNLEAELWGGDFRQIVTLPIALGRQYGARHIREQVLSETVEL